MKACIVAFYDAFRCADVVNHLHPKIFHSDDLEDCCDAIYFIRGPEIYCELRSDFVHNCITVPDH